MRGGRVGVAYWPVLKGPMLRIFVIDAVLFVANLVVVFLLRVRVPDGRFSQGPHFALQHHPQHQRQIVPPVRLVQNPRFAVDAVERLDGMLRCSRR